MLYNIITAGILYVNRVKMIKVVRLLIYICLGLSTPLYGYAEKKVLILCSYHQGYVWTDELNRGILTALKKSGLDLDIRIEYMDTKHYYNGQYFSILNSIYKYKYSTDKFNIIISCDNDALKFLSLYRGDLFPGTPVIYCGINNYEPSLVSGQSNCTVVAEEYNLKEIFDNILHLHENVRNIFVVSDKTTTGTNMEKVLADIIPSYENRLSFHIENDLTEETLLEKIKVLPDDTAILLVSFLKDKNGKSFDHIKVTKLISDNSPVPVYGYISYLLGYGIVGGSLKSPFRHGEITSNLAIDVLKGKNINSIPVMYEKFDTNFYDYNQLKRWNINKNILPAGSVIINDPFKFYYENKRKLLSIFIIILIQTAIIILLISNVVKRKKVQRRLTKAKCELESKNEEIQSVVYAASHDLRTPLVNIHGFYKLNKEYFDKLNQFISANINLKEMSEEISHIINEKIPYAFNIVFSNILRMDTLLNGLLSVSRIGDIKISLEYLDMNCLIANILNQMSFQIKENNIKIDVAPNLPQCYSDRDMTIQIFTNLISNSIKYRNKQTDSFIKIFGYRKDESVYCVEDNGIGIPQEYKDKIFELYHRLNPKDSKDGEGLGLTIVKRILFRLNGRIWVESEKGMGSKFYVALPKDRVK